jgi:hypothetical protein
MGIEERTGVSLKPLLQSPRCILHESYRPLLASLRPIVNGRVPSRKIPPSAFWNAAILVQVTWWSPCPVRGSGFLIYRCFGMSGPMVGD